jgi:hypothetical protein
MRPITLFQEDGPEGVEMIPNNTNAWKSVRRQIPAVIHTQSPSQSRAANDLCQCRRAMNTVTIENSESSHHTTS